MNVLWNGNHAFVDGECIGSFEHHNIGSANEWIRVWDMNGCYHDQSKTDEQARELIVSIYRITTKETA